MNLVLTFELDDKAMDFPGYGTNFNAASTNRILQPDSEQMLMRLCSLKPLNSSKVLPSGSFLRSCYSVTAHFPCQNRMS